MFIAILILIIIASLLLTFVVLIQNSKGGGLAANFAAGNQTFGVLPGESHLDIGHHHTGSLYSGYSFYSFPEAGRQCGSSAS